MFSFLLVPLFSKNQGRSIHFDTCIFRLAKKYSKSVQIEVKVYMEIAGPMTERGKKTNLVSDAGDQRYSSLKKANMHVDWSDGRY